MGGGYLIPIDPEATIEAVTIVRPRRVRSPDGTTQVVQEKVGVQYRNADQVNDGRRSKRRLRASGMSARQIRRHAKRLKRELRAEAQAARAALKAPPSAPATPP